MERTLYIVILLASAYIVDHLASGGRATMPVNNLALQADYKVKDLLRPLGK